MSLLFDSSLVAKNLSVTFIQLWEEKCTMMFLQCHLQCEWTLNTEPGRSPNHHPGMAPPKPPNTHAVQGCWVLKVMHVKWLDSCFSVTAILVKERCPQFRSSPIRSVNSEIGLYINPSLLLPCSGSPPSPATDFPSSHLCFKITVLSTLISTLLVYPIGAEVVTNL